MSATNDATTTTIHTSKTNFIALVTIHNYRLVSIIEEAFGSRCQQIQLLLICSVICCLLISISASTLPNERTTTASTTDCCAYQITILHVVNSTMHYSSLSTTDSYCSNYMMQFELLLSEQVDDDQLYVITNPSQHTCIVGLNAHLCLSSAVPIENIIELIDTMINMNPLLTLRDLQYLLMESTRTANNYLDKNTIIPLSMHVPDSQTSISTDIISTSYDSNSVTYTFNIREELHLERLRILFEADKLKTNYNFTLTINTPSGLYITSPTLLLDHRKHSSVVYNTVRLWAENTIGTWSMIQTFHSPLTGNEIHDSIIHLDMFGTRDKRYIIIPDPTPTSTSPLPSSSNKHPWLSKHLQSIVIVSIIGGISLLIGIIVLVQVIRLQMKDEEGEVDNQIWAEMQESVDKGTSSSIEEGIDNFESDDEDLKL
jgi:hypothetical protein